MPTAKKKTAAKKPTKKAAAKKPAKKAAAKKPAAKKAPKKYTEIGKLGKKTIECRGTRKGVSCRVKKAAKK